MTRLKNILKRAVGTLSPDDVTKTRPEGIPRASVAASSAPDPVLAEKVNTPTTPHADLTGPDLSIPCPDPTAEEQARDLHHNRGLRLARQENWEELAAQICAADQARLSTPGGMPVAELLAFGARFDVVQAADHALIDGRPERDAPLMSGIEALEHVLEEFPNDYVIACIVAQTHMDMGWAWRGTGWDAALAKRNREVFLAHFDRANDILSEFSNKAIRSPLLGSTCCALLGGTDASERTVADSYEALIDFNPNNAGPMRAMGNLLLPRWFGSYDGLELEARRTAARLEAQWGAGGYTWVQFDAISTDDEACARLDVPFFIEGMRDILARRPDPQTTNLLAAYCANTHGQAYTGNDQADQNRTEIAACADWIVREYLTELHPMIWAHAAQGFDNSLRVRSAERFAAAGQADAMRILKDLFQREIAAGKRIVFTEKGPEARQA